MLRTMGRLTIRFGEVYNDLAVPPAADVADIAVDGASDTEVYTGVCAMDEMYDRSDAIAYLVGKQAL